MNREQTIKAIGIMQSWLDGKTIQVKGDGDKAWADAAPVELESGQPAWQWKTNVYRIKPAEPRTRYVVTDGAGNETLYFHDPSQGLAVFETVAKFVELMEDEAKPSQPPSPPPRTGPLFVGDRVKFIGNLKDVPMGTLATVLAANPTARPWASSSTAGSGTRDLPCGGHRLSV